MNDVASVIAQLREEAEYEMQNAERLDQDITKIESQLRAATQASKRSWLKVKAFDAAADALEKGES